MDIKTITNLRFELELAKKNNDIAKVQKINRIIEEYEKDSRRGLASFDKPWLQQYKANPDDFHYDTEIGVWSKTKEILEKYSDVPFIEYFGRTISREEFSDYVEMWAKALKSLGVEEGDQLPLYVPATPESYAIFLAANAIGAIPYFQKLSISKQSLEEETKSAKVAVVFDGLWGNVKDVFGQNRFKNVIVTSAADSMMFPLKQLTKIKSYFEAKQNKTGIPKEKKYLWAKDIKAIADYNTGEFEVPFKPHRTAIITTSSGTTSHNVKGIMDSNEGVLASLLCTMEAETGFTKGKRTLTCFPPTASTSINCLQLLPTFTGGTIIFDPRVDISKWYNQVMKYRPDITISTGSVWERFADDVIRNEKNGQKTDLSWVDYFIMGGAGTTPQILDMINDTIRSRGAKRNIRVGYGFSEVFGVLSVQKYDDELVDKELKHDVINVGCPLPGYNVGLFDENGKEIKYGSGERGELWINAPSNMQGYYGKEDLTKKTIVDDWIHSGDLCEIDKYGNIFVYGRLKHSIDVNGKKTYLFDIANDIRNKFGLHEVLIENKKLKDGSDSVVAYFCQNDDSKVDSQELLEKIDEYLKEKNIVIDGYKEHEHSLPIDPTTIKPKTNDTTGFIKYVDGIKYNVEYSEVSLDVYEKNISREKTKRISK